MADPQHPMDDEIRRCRDCGRWRRVTDLRPLWNGWSCRAHDEDRSERCG